jgi:hypothetical protein
MARKVCRQRRHRTRDRFETVRVLVQRAMAYAKAFPEEVGRSREGETDG